MNRRTFLKTATVTSVVMPTLSDLSLGDNKVPEPLPPLQWRNLAKELPPPDAAVLMWSGHHGATRSWVANVVPHRHYAGLSAIEADFNTWPVLDTKDNPRRTEMTEAWGWKPHEHLPVGLRRAEPTLPAWYSSPDPQKMSCKIAYGVIGKSEMFWIDAYNLVHQSFIPLREKVPPRYAHILLKEPYYDLSHDMRVLYVAAEVLGYTDTVIQLAIRSGIPMQVIEIGRGTYDSWVELPP